MDYKLLRTVECNQQAVRRIKFNVDGQYCLSCGADRTIKLWSPVKSLLLKTYFGHSDEVLDACGSCDSRHILSGGTDRSVIYWDVATGKSLRILRTHVSKVYCVRFNEESTLAVSGSRDNSVLLWDLKSRDYRPIQELREAKDCVTSIIVTDNEIITSSLDCRIRKYDIRACSLVTDFIGVPVVSMTMTQDGLCYIISGNENKVMLFEKSTGELLNTYNGHILNNCMIEIGIDHKSNFIMSGSADGFVYCWDLYGSQVLRKFEHPGVKLISTLDLHPTKDYMLSSGGTKFCFWGIEEPDSEE